MEARLRHPRPFPLLQWLTGLALCTVILSLWGASHEHKPRDLPEGFGNGFSCERAEDARGVATPREDFADEPRGLNLRVLDH